MFSSHTAIEKLNAEVLINISSFLDVPSLLQFSLTAKAFRHLIRDELVFRRFVERDYRVTDKQAEKTWVEIYKELKLKKSNVAVAAAAAAAEEPVVTEEETEDIIDTTVQEATTDDASPSVVEKEETIVTQTTVEEKTTTASTTTATTTEPVVEKTESPSEQQQQQPVVETVAKIEEVPSTSTTDCAHLEKVSDSINEIKRILYNNKSETLCDLCLSKTSAYLNMSDSCHIEACRSCLETEADDEEHFPVQLELSTCKLYCFKCKDENGASPRLLDGNEKAQKIIAYIKTPASDDDLDKRRKAEQQLYVQELRREDMSLKHYLVEKQWGRSWMLFRTREGSPSPGKITNQKLARLNGTLDPNIRLPMDKYRPSPETHADIVSERLWSYLVRAYGVQGRAYSEDDIIAPEYARLRVYVDDYKKSIHLYP